MAKIFQYRRVEGASGEADIKMSSDVEQGGLPHPKVKIPQVPVSVEGLLGQLDVALPSVVQEATTTYGNLTAVRETVNEVKAAQLSLRNGLLVPVEDSYVNEALPDNNFGGATLLQIASGLPLVQDQRRALLLFDLTEMEEFDDDPLTGTSSDMITLDVYLETPVLNTLFELTIDGLISANKPYDENTVTWNNRPIHPMTAIEVIEIPLLAPPGRRRLELDLSVDGSFQKDLAGNWFSCEFRMSGLLEVGVFSVRSHDHPSAERPELDALNVYWSL